MKVLTRKIGRELKDLRWQLFSMAVVLAVGVALLLASLSAYQALKRAQADFYRMSRFSHVFASFSQAPDSVAARIESIPGVLQVETRIAKEVLLDVPSLDGVASARLVSMPDSGPQLLNRVFLRRGRMPRSMYEVLASEAFATANKYEPGSSITAIINGKRERLLITGVALSPEYIFAFRPATILPDDRFYGILWVRRELLSGAYNMYGACNDIIVLLDQSVSPELVAHQMDNILEPYGNPGSVTRARQPSHLFVTEEMGQLKATAVYMPVIFLGVAAFILHLVVGRMIERQREIIASFKALGYYNREIVLHYSALVLSIAAAGSLLGIPGGIWLGQYWTGMYQEYYHFPELRFVLSPEVVAAGLAAALVSAGAGGYSALRSILQLDPAQAMRPPAPRAYQSGILDRIPAFRRSRSQTRIALRPMLARPIRTMLGVTGMSFGIVVVVIGFFWLDAVDMMMALQSNVLDRGRASVAFQRPLSKEALSSLAAAPGVLRVEGRRSAAVRITNGLRQKTTAIMGIDSTHELRRVIDAEYRPVQMGGSGLYLNRVVARKLGVAPGMSVRVELLEKDRRVRDIRVAAVVEEVMGGGAYMTAGALNSLLDEQGLITDAALHLDSARKTEFLEWTRTNPGIAGIALRERVLGLFRDTMERTITGFVVVLIVLAFAIAMGVIYNSALVTLGEHNREFGTLRVLGFHRSEVFEVFVVELFAELLLAVPIGCLIGTWTAAAMLSLVPEDTFQVPLYISLRSYGLAIAVMFAAAAFTMILIWRKIRKMDFISVLKLRD